MFNKRLPQIVIIDNKNKDHLRKYILLIKVDQEYIKQNAGNFYVIATDDIYIKSLVGYYKQILYSIFQMFQQCRI